MKRLMVITLLLIAVGAWGRGPPRNIYVTKYGSIGAAYMSSKTNIGEGFKNITDDLSDDFFQTLYRVCLSTGYKKGTFAVIRFVDAYSPDIAAMYWVILYGNGKASVWVPM